MLTFFNTGSAAEQQRRGATADQPFSYTRAKYDLFFFVSRVTKMVFWYLRSQFMQKRIALQLDEGHLAKLVMRATLDMQIQSVPKKKTVRIGL